MTHVYIGLGSNLDNPAAQISKAISRLENLPATDFIKCSTYYQSKPVGPQNQPDYVNAVAMLDTDLEALNLLDHLHAIEDQQGRVRGRERWGPRILDLDLLLYGDEQINKNRLIVPHPEMHKRDFVLYPLSEIAPDLEIPGLGSITELLKHLDSNKIKAINL